jgi:hypothetical protein
MANWMARAQAIVAPSVPANDDALPGATPEQAAELRKLVALIFADADEVGRGGVLRAALADPEAALTSFRLLAADAMDRKRHEARFGST